MIAWASAGFLVVSLLLIELSAAFVRSTGFIWNEIRLCRSMALARGFPLYPAKDNLGPVIGTLHTPVSHIIYLLVRGFSSPTDAMLAGSVFSFLLVLSALIFTVVRGGRAVTRRWLVSGVAVVFCLFLILETPGTYNAVFMIHVDAAGLAFLTVACGLLCDPNRPVTIPDVWLSGVACVLAASCKQTFAPAAPAILCFLAIVGTRRHCVHFVAALTASGILLFGAFAAAFSAPDFLFNIVTLASARPFKSDYPHVIFAAFRAARLDALPALMPVAFLAAYAYIREHPRPPIRVFIAANRWFVFLFASVALLAVSVKAVAVVGADVNHLGAVLYLLYVAAGLALLRTLSDTQDPVRRLSAAIFAVLGIFVSLAPGTLHDLLMRLPLTRANSSEAAYRYELRHPEGTYFPWNPMASLLVTHKLYHLDNALYDRELAGYPLTAAQLQSGLPLGWKRVAVPPGQDLLSDSIRQLVAGATQRLDPELPGWTIYEVHR